MQKKAAAALLILLYEEKDKIRENDTNGAKIGNKGKIFFTWALFVNCILTSRIIKLRSVSIAFFINLMIVGKEHNHENGYFTWKTIYCYSSISCHWFMFGRSEIYNN